MRSLLVRRGAYAVCVLKDSGLKVWARTWGNALD